MGSTASSIPLIDKLNEKQLSGYDIPNIDSNKFEQYDKNTINFLFDQFKYKYNDFYIKRAHKNQAEVNIDISMRKNISVLVIVGSSFQIPKSNFFEGKYLKSAEDLDTALLIRHLFHYAFGVPMSQILITSTQNNDFQTKGIVDDLISAPNPIFNGINDINPKLLKQKNNENIPNKTNNSNNENIPNKTNNSNDENIPNNSNNSNDENIPNNSNNTNDENISNNENVSNNGDQQIEQCENYRFDISNKEEFLIFQNINLAQVGAKQYKFYFNENLEEIIKPFNTHIIDQELSTNKDSHLFVFFLDHGYAGGFGEIPYQFFIERLLNITCKHFYVFNDSCFSGSMIILIKICESFQKIFPGIKEPTVESALFHFLTNLNKVDPNLIPEAIKSKIHNIDSYQISNDAKNEVKSILMSILPTLYSDISKFVLNLDQFTSIGCVPNHFVQFSKKSTIFASSSFDQISLTLPGRKYNISILGQPRIRVFGSVFSSIIIESLLDKKAQLSLDNFRQSIHDRLIYYKDQFIKIIEKQNQYIDKKTVNTLLPNKDQITSFFSADFCDKFHFSNNGNDWPDLSSIMLNIKYWNVDQSDVNVSEYDGVYFCMFRKHLSQTKIENPNKYGPVKGSYYIDKFMEDFEHEVRSLFDKYEIQKQFKINNSKFTNNPKLRDELSTKSCLNYDQFIGLIRPTINSANFQAIKLLKAPLSLFFIENPNDVENTIFIFSEAFKKVIPFWKDYEL